jgi:putative helicase MOV10L1/helicase MOV-10
MKGKAAKTAEDVKVSEVAQPEPNHGDVEEHVPGFDVYATPFVPQALKDINSAPGTVLSTQPLRFVDLGDYATSNLGQHLLPPVPQPIALDLTVQPSAWNLTPATYEVYFRSWLESEIRSQRKENSTYSLYDTTATVTFPAEGGPATCTILVPGLREYSPYVEEDDVVELRQLRHELTAPGIMTLARHLPWNMYTYHARVSAAVRAKELLVLQAQGLTPNTAEIWSSYGGYPLPTAQHQLRFNVAFPVPDERYRPMRHVLPHIQVALEAAASHTLTEIDNPGISCGADDFHYWLQSMLFPTEADCDLQANLHSGHFNQSFVDDKLNWPQKNAVENVCLQNYGTVPYIISGPPGTGKTKTLIETALQLLRNVGHVSHILLCAPSEPATDTLADRLRQHLAPHEMLRLNRPSRPFSEVSDEVLPYCYVSENIFALPPFADLMKYRVVVTSCRDASLLMYSRMTNSDLYAAEHGLRRCLHPFDPPPSQVKLHWTALLLDEAAQALEPEALLPMYIVAPPLRSPPLAFTPLVVMAGDERQLGPRTSSPKTPLKRSLFARLMSRPVYADHPLARGKKGQAPPPLSTSMLPILRPAFSNLIHNYRSHPAILAVPSSLFYFDTLEPQARDTSALAGWDGWRGRKWPVLFHHNPSPDDLERDGGGWLNPGEAAIACGYAARLSAFLGGRQQEVCIMSPFKAQVRLLRKRARSEALGLHDVNIGPTEAFQGLEHGVVILCVTRSNRRFVEKDKELSWGIIGQPNKMNVALTRAKYGLIIVGDRDVLVDDPHWRTVLDFCYRNGLVTGDEGGAEDEDSLTPRDGPLTRIEREMLGVNGSTSSSNGV